MLRKQSSLPLTWAEKLEAGAQGVAPSEKNHSKPSKEHFTGTVHYRDNVIGHFQMDVLHIPKIQGKRQFNLNTWTWVDLWKPSLSPSGVFMTNIVASGEKIKERLAIVGVTLVEDKMYNKI